MNSLEKVPFIGGFIRQLNADAEKNALPQVMRNLISRANGTLEIYGKNKEVTEILKTKPVLLVANHPDEADAFALIASLPNRANIFIIVNGIMMGAVPNIDKYLLPVYIDHHVNPKHNPFTSWFIKRPKQKKLSPDEEHTLNIKTITQAAKHLTDGALVVLFPGRRSIDGHWFSGIGHLLTQTKNHKNIFIMRAYIQGTSPWDYLRIVPMIGKLLPPVSITYAPPLTLDNVWNSDPKKITATIEKGFLSWSKNL